MKNPYKNIKLFTLLAVMVAMVGCSNDDDNLKQGDLSFEITSSDFECVSGEEHAVSVPAEGQIYSFMVDASDATSWTVTLEGGAWITVNPVAKQRGSGEIIIKAAENTGNESNRSALISITNTANEEVYTYRFSQEYDAEYIRPEQNYYTYLIGGGEQDMTFKVENIELNGNVTFTTSNESDALDMKEYSIRYETTCELLKDTHYSNLKYENNTLSVTFDKTYISQLNLTKDYLLPVTFLQDEVAVRRVWIIVNAKSSGGVPMGDELPKLKLTQDDLFLNNFQWAVDRRRLVDGALGEDPEKPGQQSVWASQWNPNKDPNFDAVYGTYIDVNLPANNGYKYFAFNYATGNGVNNVPCHIKVYAGETDKDLVLYGEFKRVENDMPITAWTWFKAAKADMPVFDLKGKKINKIRISILQSYDAKNKKDNPVMTDTSHNKGGANFGKNHPSVSAGEIAIYAL